MTIDGLGDEKNGECKVQRGKGVNYHQCATEETMG